MAKGLKRHQRNNWLRVLRPRLRPWGIRQAQAPTISAARDVRYSTFETNLKREHHGPLRLKPFLLAAQERTFHVLTTFRSFSLTVAEGRSIRSNRARLKPLVSGYFC